MRKRLTEKFIVSSDETLLKTDTCKKTFTINASLENAIDRYHLFTNSKQLDHEVQEKIETSTR